MQTGDVVETIYLCLLAVKSKRPLFYAYFADLCLKCCILEAESKNKSSGSTLRPWSKFVKKNFQVC
jgi:hypothetical protein